MTQLFDVMITAGYYRVMLRMSLLLDVKNCELVHRKQSLLRI